MLKTRLLPVTHSALLLAVALASVLLTPVQANAAAPATVTVRVQGFNGETLLPQTQVRTNTTPVPVEGGTCSGTSAGGALYDATHGDWEVKEVTQGVEIDGIEGLNLPSFAENPGVYWAFWLNATYATQGACGEELSEGADIVFFPQCYETGALCPSGATAPDHFLTLTPPGSRIANVGEPVSLTVGSVGTGSGTPEVALPAGVTVTGGTVNASPGSGDVATLSFTTAGSYTLQAHAPDSVPSDPYMICVHNGNDGNCGTTLPGGSAGPVVLGASPVTAPAPYVGPFALVPAVSGLTDGHVYPRGTGPRLLSGTVHSHNAISSVDLELRREFRGRCWAYDGTRERFRAAHCGSGSFFQVASNDTFSYQLPAALSPGRYVLDIKASDSAGNHTALARGSSRIVFYVR